MGLGWGGKDPDYEGAAKRALSVGEVRIASFENGCVNHACCLCWLAIKIGELAVPVYEDVQRPAHLVCIQDLLC